jgi:hypothetical protein
MSIGNVKTEGSKGNNFPWQLRMLNGLQGIIDTLNAGVCCPPQARTPNVTRATGAWTSTANIYSFSVANVGVANGTAMGQTIKPGEIENFDAGGMNNFFPTGIPVANGTGTELLISWISA